MTNYQLIPTPDEIKAIEFMAKNATDSKYFEKLGGFAGIICIAMYARELGLPPMQCLMGGMSNVLGKIQLSPQMMNGMIRKAGHKLVIKSSKLECRIEGTRNDTGENYTASFSVEDAKNAGLFKTGGGWDKYPEDMCFARALSRLARRLFPDVIGTAYVEGEIEDSEVETKKSSKTLANAEILTEKEKSNEDLRKDFYDRFDALETEKGILGEYLNTSPDPYTSIRKALSDPNGFEKVIPQLPSMLKRQKEKKQADKTKEQVLRAMSNEAILMPAEQLSLEMEMANKTE